MVDADVLERISPSSIHGARHVIINKTHYGSCVTIYLMGGLYKSS